MADQVGERFEDSINNVCSVCMSANLLEEIKIARCATCNKIYCVHFASAIDPAHCLECLSEISLIKETVVKEYQHYNEDTDVVTTYRRKAERIKLEGMNWLFAQRKQAILTDDEIELAVEYHRSYLNGLLGEREARRVAKAHRFAGVQMPSGSPDRSVTTTKTKKTIKSTKEEKTVQGILQSLNASGLSAADILKLLQGTGVTK